MAFYLNQLITDYIVATSGRLFPPAGGTNASLTPAGVLFVPTIVAIATGSDTYRVTFAPTSSGVWRFDVTDSLGEQWVQVYEVTSASRPAFTRVVAGGVIQATTINDMQVGIETSPV